MMQEMKILVYGIKSLAEAFVTDQARGGLNIKAGRWGREIIQSRSKINFKQHRNGISKVFGTP